MIAIDQLIRSRRKTIALVVTADGKLVVRAPLRVPRAQIEQVVQEKADWIRTHQADMMARPRPEMKSFRSGETFLFLGKAYPLRLSAGRPATLNLKDGAFVSGSRNIGAKTFERWYRAQARIVLEQRVNLLAALMRCQPKALRITSARTRWGSCSSRGTLSFPWRLVLAPLDVIDYVVIHELVHLEIRNHSKAFWARVAAACPTYQTHRRWLKEHNTLGDDLVPPP